MHSQSSCGGGFATHAPIVVVAGIGCLREWGRRALLASRWCTDWRRHGRNGLPPGWCPLCSSATGTWRSLSHPLSIRWCDRYGNRHPRAAAITASVCNLTHAHSCGPIRRPPICFLAAALSCNPPTWKVGGLREIVRRQTTRCSARRAVHRHMRRPAGVSTPRTAQNDAYRSEPCAIRSPRLRTPKS